MTAKGKLGRFLKLIAPGKVEAMALRRGVRPGRVRSDGSRTACEAPSAWVRRWSHLVPAGGTVLDVACGQRPAHALVRAARPPGDRRRPRPRGGRRRAAAWAVRWPPTSRTAPGRCAGETFAAVVVTNYLWRPAVPAPAGQPGRTGGVLIYETFAEGNETVGKPSRPDFLLRHGELLRPVHRPADRGLRGRLPRGARALRAAHRGGARAARQRKCALHAPGPLNVRGKDQAAGQNAWPLALGYQSRCRCARLPGTPTQAS